MKKVIIVSPDPIYGGSIVLFKLNQLLIEEGVDSKILISNVYKKPNQSNMIFWIKWFIKSLMDITKFKKNKFSNIKRKLLPFFDKENTIVIYPEIIFGNPLFAKNVVRYFLYYDRYKEYSNAYGKDDLFICYREQFNDWNKNPDGNKLNIKSFNKDLYKQTNFNERDGKCYLFYKGKNRKDLPVDLDGILLDNLSEEDKVNVLNQCKYCFIYDMQTFYADIAAVCGCIPILVLEEGKTKDDYRKKDDKESYGIAYGNNENEINYAIKTRQQLIDRLNKIDKDNEKEIKEFLNLLEERFDLYGRE